MAEAGKARGADGRRRVTGPARLSVKLRPVRGPGRARRGDATAGPHTHTPPRTTRAPAGASMRSRKMPIAIF